MPDQLTDHETRLLRQRSQRLDSPLPGSPEAVVQVVRHLVGVQAQDPRAAALAVRARCARLTAADVERARVEDRSIVRTWCMRGTLHLIPTEDFGWLMDLIGPVFVRAGRGRRAQLGLDDESGPLAVRTLCTVLAEHGPSTRDQIVEHLAERGIRLAGQARPHLLGLAALEGMICLGPMQGRQPTYVRVSDWIVPGPALAREQALARLAERYLAAFAPATPGDFATWSGLSLTDARSGWRQIAPLLAEVEVAGSPAWMLKAQQRWLGDLEVHRLIVRLVPNFDNYLLGYRSRDLIIADEHARRVYSGGGMLHPVVLVDGQGQATWKLDRRRSSIDVIVEPFEGLADDLQAGLEREIADLAHYSGAAVRLEIKAPPK